jgi:hypothetical protein
MSPVLLRDDPGLAYRGYRRIRLGRWFEAATYLTLPWTAVVPKPNIVQRRYGALTHVAVTARLQAGWGRWAVSVEPRPSWSAWVAARLPRLRVEARLFAAEWAFGAIAFRVGLAQRYWSVAVGLGPLVVEVETIPQFVFGWSSPRRPRRLGRGGRRG